MSYEKQLINKGKELAFLLRHDMDAYNAGLINSEGWRQVSELIKEHGYTHQMLDDIVETNNKKRYEYSFDKKRIRARQGHSIPVDVGLEEKEPPAVLYHGTSRRAYYNSIIKEGLKPMSRQYVHLSIDEETATNVGSRHDAEPVILIIDSAKMFADGIKFYLSANGVWMTKEVPANYINIKQ